MSLCSLLLQEIIEDNKALASFPSGFISDEREKKDIQNSMKESREYRDLMGPILLGFFFGRLQIDKAVTPAEFLFFSLQAQATAGCSFGAFLSGVRLKNQPAIFITKHSRSGL